MGMIRCAKYLFIVAAVCLALVAAGCESARPSPTVQKITVSEDMELQPITEGVWVHTTYFDLPNFGRYPANGLVVLDGEEAVLIDLPWTDGQTGVLFDWIAENHGATVRTVVPTHFHQDCMGGLAEAHRRGAQSYGLDKTITIAREKGLPVPKISYQSRAMVRCGKKLAIMTYFGPGHTLDNVVVWLPKQKVLFGGCLIKSLDAASLGNTNDGDLEAYPTTVDKVRGAYPHAEIVVPGHGAWGGVGLIAHTRSLCPPTNPEP